MGLFDNKNDFEKHNITMSTFEHKGLWYYNITVIGCVIMSYTPNQGYESEDQASRYGDVAATEELNKEKRRIREFGEPDISLGLIKQLVNSGFPLPQKLRNKV